MYSNMLVPGTFDHLHEGHKYHLSKCVALSNKLSIAMLSRNDVSGMQSINVRVRAVKDYLRQLKFSNYVIEIVPITDTEDILEYCELKQDPAVDAIAASVEAFDNPLYRRLVEEWNVKRVADALPKVEWVLIPLILDKMGIPHSSTRLRNYGERTTVNALDIVKVSPGKFKITHKGKDTVLSLQQLKKVVTSYLRQFNEGDTDELNPIVNTELQSHRREIYDYIVANKLFDITFPTHQTKTINKLDITVVDT